MPRLTLRLINSTDCPPSGELWLADDTLPGFGARLRAGRKTYGVRYRTPTGQLRRETLGLTTVLTLDQARQAAQALLVAVRQGEDPAAKRHAMRHAPTLAQLAARYLTEHAALKKKPRSVQNDRINLAKHLLPALGTTRVPALTTAQIATLHHQMRATPPAANRCVALLSHMLTMAEHWGLRPPGTNPARGIPRYRERRRERFLSAAELARLGAALAEAEAMRTELPQVLTAIRLLLLTGARLGEVLGLQWDYIDAERGVARLPDSKTGPKLLRLPGPAMTLLRALPHAEGQAYVLPGLLPGKPLVNPWGPWKRLCAAAGLEGIRIHDIRHSWASHGAMSGLSLPMLGQLLGHSSPSMTQRYIAWAQDPVQAASEQVGAVMAAALGGKA